MKILITMIVSLASLSSFSQNITHNDTITNSIEENKKIELSKKEKYAVSMLKKSYTIKSIMGSTNLPKARIKELKKLIDNGEI